MSGKLDPDFLERNLEQSVYIQIPGSQQPAPKRYVMQKQQHPQHTSNLFENVLCLNCSTFVPLVEFDGHSL
jgi:hypothetical protein